MAKNKFSDKFKATPGKDEWDKICPLGEYRVFDGTTAHSMGIVPEGMLKVNSVAVGASGSQAGPIMYFVNHFRIDGGKIDQEPYIELYEKGSMQPCLHGIFHHADFPGRTEEQDSIARAIISASGSNAGIQFAAKPDNNSGTLDSLRAQGKISGFDYAWKEGMKKKDA
jgi:hypothetical protein